MANHPIEALMTTTMENLKQMVDVNTIVGDPVETKDGTVIIPISQISLGFASGGGQYGKKTSTHNTTNEKEKDKDYPFGGGSGAGISVKPSAFIVVGNGQMKLLPVDNESNIVNNFLDLIPALIEGIQNRIATKKPKTQKNKTSKTDSNCKLDENKKDEQEAN
ncbi:GerW family sporulation protein [Abyssisolibacter fermentans]|uniref:GerW family sporulation protein n=1 Tax=Abyssisolibacter fermentans TaxID=1766203 RepID=UPI00082A3EE5|nr:GerW family sporulation protein [Abyssisolibacter fermentans]